MYFSQIIIAQILLIITIMCIILKSMG